MKPKRISKTLLLLIAFGSLPIAIMVRQVAFQLADRRTATNIESVLAVVLSNNTELTQRHGRFLRLEGSRLHRQKSAFPLLQFLTMTRTAIFERGEEGLTITISGEQSILPKKPDVHDIVLRRDETGKLAVGVPLGRKYGH